MLATRPATARETMVWSLFRRGYDTTQIASLIGCGEGEAYNHLSRTLDKVAASRSEHHRCIRERRRAPAPAYQ